MKKFTLSVKETNNKAARFHYTVTDENGTIICERKSNRVYVACLSNGSMFFGRLDLIGKGDHGRQIKMVSNWIATEELNRERNISWLAGLNEIAYLETK